MNKVKCSNGHFFDADRFESCPICGAEASAAVKVETPATTADRIPSTTPLLEAEQSLSSEVPISEEMGKIAPLEKLHPENSGLKEDSIPEKVIQNKSQQPVTSTPALPQSGVAPSSGDLLRKAVEATASTRTSALPKTVAYYDFDTVEPPVGWLICVKGEYIGHTFECKTGRNRIGRNQDMEINLADDLTVTREAQAIIIYEPKKRQFFIQVGAGDGLVYLNGEMVFSHEPLAPYDMLSLGKTDFIFLPLCGEKFSWDEYIKEG